MRHRAIATLISTFATLLLATSALAGGWAQVTMTEPASDPPAGAGTIMEFTVLQHGETPISWMTLGIVARENVTGKVIRTEAKPDGPAGHYVATLTFPTEGVWTISYESPDLLVDGTIRIQVAPSLATGGEPTTVTPAAAETAPVLDPLAIGLVAISVLTLLTVIAAAVRGRPGRNEKSAVTSG